MKAKVVVSSTGGPEGTDPKSGVNIMLPKALDGKNLYVNLDTGNIDVRFSSIIDRVVARQTVEEIEVSQEFVDCALELAKAQKSINEHATLFEDLYKKHVAG